MQHPQRRHMVFCGLNTNTYMDNKNGGSDSRESFLGTGFLFTLSPSSFLSGVLGASKERAFGGQEQA